ncbi:MAG: Cyclic pyranopterin phosphate synthase MoaA [Fibrobacteres bacterium]|nr:Cyclic pyranopterin phosphate synthase MoaA [Fibrobacterota bacterium]
MPLIDPHGRLIRKLRVQLTDACNFRCFYCMPAGTRFHPSHLLLSPEEIGDIASALAALGVDEIRVTGGEPTVRPEFDAIMERLARTSWRKFGLTTNGFLLAGKLPLLSDLGCRHVNVSLDSLEEPKFRSITGSPHFRKVVASILKAKAMGFEVKVNTIVFRGINDHELPAFLDFSSEHGVEVRFLELMKVGPSIGVHEERFVPAAEMIDRLRAREDLLPVPSSVDSTSFGFRTPRGGRVGFIASESQPFCGACSRLRLTATGKLRSCLFSDTGSDLRGRDPLDYPEILREVMALKPTGRLPRIPQPMNQIGG